MHANAEQWSRGAVIGDRFVLERKLGTGGFASVWLAADVDRAPVALKILHARHRRSASVRERFEREARLLGQLVHPHIAGARAFHFDEDLAFIAIEYVPGRSLRAALDARGRSGGWLGVDEIAEILLPIMDALAHAHRAGVIHRDVKPANIILGEGWPRVPKLVDFGIAKDLALDVDAQSTCGPWVGSVTYLSPEQILATGVDARTDVFALGALLFELATLRRLWARGADGDPLLATPGPFVLHGLNDPGAVMRRIVREPRPPLDRFRPDLPAALGAVIARACEVAPGARFADVVAMRAAFEAALSPGRGGMGDAEPTAITPIEDLLSTERSVVGRARSTVVSPVLPPLGLPPPVLPPLGPPPVPPVSLAPATVAPATVAAARIEAVGLEPVTRPIAFPALAPAIELHARYATAPAPSPRRDSTRLLPTAAGLAPPPGPALAGPHRSGPAVSTAVALAGLLAALHVALWSLAGRDPLVFAPALGVLAIGLLVRGVLEQRAHLRLRQLMHALLVDATPGIRWSRVDPHDDGYVLSAAAGDGGPESLALQLPLGPAWRSAQGPLQARIAWSLPPGSALRSSRVRTVVIAELVARHAPALPPAAADLLRAAQRALAEAQAHAATVEGDTVAVTVEWPAQDVTALVRAAHAAVRVFKTLSTAG